MQIYACIRLEYTDTRLLILFVSVFQKHLSFFFFFCFFIIFLNELRIKISCSRLNESMRVHTFLVRSKLRTRFPRLKLPTWNRWCVKAVDSKVMLFDRKEPSRCGFAFHPIIDRCRRCVLSSIFFRETQNDAEWYLNHSKIKLTNSCF